MANHLTLVPPLDTLVFIQNISNENSSTTSVLNRLDGCPNWYSKFDCGGYENIMSYYNHEGESSYLQTGDHVKVMFSSLQFAQMLIVHFKIDEVFHQIVQLLLQN